MKLFNSRSFFIFAASATVGALLTSFLLTACSPGPTGVLSTKTLDSAAPTPTTAPLKTAGQKQVSVVAPDPRRTVYIVGEVGYGALETAAQITKLGQESLEPIYVVLTSPGGSVLTGGQVIAAIESSKAPVYTVCNVLCASMAAMIFEYGSQRYIGDRSFVMFHPATGGAEGEIDKMVSRLASMQRYIGKMEAYVGVKAKLTFDQYKAKSQVEAWIDGEDAVNNGFADHIATVALPKNNPFSGLFGAKALYDAIYLRHSPSIGSTTTNPADFQWIASPQDLQWLSF